MQQHYTTIEEIKKNSFLYIEYGIIAHIQRIIILTSLLLFLIFTTISLTVDLYQIFAGNTISKEGVFSFLSKSNHRNTHLFYGPMPIGPIIMFIILISIPLLTRSILLTGDIYFCENDIYIKKVLFFNKLKIFGYKDVNIQYNNEHKGLYFYRNEKLILTSDRNGYLDKTIYPFDRFLFLLKYMLLYGYQFRILKKNNNLYNIYPYNCCIIDAIYLFKSYNINVIYYK